GSHHGDTRIIRHAYGEGEEYVSFALKAQQLWNDLEEASGKQLFLQTGVLNMGHEMTKFTQNIIASSKTYSLPLEVLHAKEVNQGATILTHSRVENVSVHKEMVSVETDSQTFNADSLIVSAGAWSKKLLNQLGLELPLNPVRKTFAWFETNESLYNEKNFPAF